jgi:hypothetical protein
MPAAAPLNVDARTEAAARHLGDFVEIRQNCLRGWVGLRRLHRSTVRCPIAESDDQNPLARSRPSDLGVELEVFSAVFCRQSLQPTRSCRRLCGPAHMWRGVPEVVGWY